MVRKKLQIVWDKPAKEELKKIYQYVKEKSEGSAKRIRDEIIETARKLAEHPEIYESDRFVPEFKGNIRSFTRWHYRITYEVTETQIILLAVSHTSQNPKAIRIIRP